MNIFVLSRDPIEAARMLCDKHVPKMLLETAQLLCGPFPPGAAPYKRTHFNHPCAKWVREDLENYCWLLAHGESLAEEFAFRFGKEHRSRRVVCWCEEHMNGLDVSLDAVRCSTTPFAQAMPDEYKHHNPVFAYRRYYVAEKGRFAKWERGRPPPRWWPKNI